MRSTPYGGAKNAGNSALKVARPTNVKHSFAPAQTQHGVPVARAHDRTRSEPVSRRDPVAKTKQIMPRELRGNCTREQSPLRPCFIYVKHMFADIATATAHQAGRPITFLFAVFIIIVWAVTGPIFHFSDTWQLIINTGTTIITFLMVFIIQNTQNRDSAAVQAKLDELIRVSSAQNILIGIEHLTEDEISEVREKCLARAKKVANGAQKNANKKAQAAINKTV